MFFESWANIARVIIVGILAYVALVFLLRISGKRTLSKMNAFDLVVTVAIGSMLGSTILTKSVPVLEGVVGLGLLIGLQYLVAWLSVRYKLVSRIVKADPTLLFYRGQYLDEVLEAQRVTREEVRAAVREQGLANLEDVTAVVLETEGSMTVVSNSQDRKQTVLIDVTDQLPWDK